MDAVVNLAEFINQLFSATVVVERLPASSLKDIFYFPVVDGQVLPELYLENDSKAGKPDPPGRENVIDADKGNFMHFTLACVIHIITFV